MAQSSRQELNIESRYVRAELCVCCRTLLEILFDLVALFCEVRLIVFCISVIVIRGRMEFYMFLSMVARGLYISAHSFS